MVHLLKTFIIFLILTQFALCKETELQEVSELGREKVRVDGAGRSSRFKRQTPEEDIFDTEDKVDRFAGNLKWSRFVKSVGNIAHGAVELMRNYSSVLSGLFSEKNSVTVQNVVIFLKVRQVLIFAFIST